MDYKTSGVDIEAGREFVSEIKQAVEGTHKSNVIEGIGGFGGLFRIPIDSFKKTSEPTNTLNHIRCMSSFNCLFNF